MLHSPRHREGCRGSQATQGRQSSNHGRPKPYLRGPSPLPQLVLVGSAVLAQGTGEPSIRPCLGSHHMMVEWAQRVLARLEEPEEPGAAPQWNPEGQLGIVIGEVRKGEAGLGCSGE